MPRKRDVHPDRWTTEANLALSWGADHFLVGLSNFTDDAGRIEWSARQLWSRICPRPDISLADVERWMAEIVAAEIYRTYTAAGKTYAECDPEHLGYISHPQKSALPEPPPTQDHSGTFRNDQERSSLPLPGPLTTDSPGVLTADAVTTPSGPYRVSSLRSETLVPSTFGDATALPGSVQPVEVLPLDGDPQEAGRVAAADVDAVWDAYRASTGRNGRYALTEKRRKLIREALRLYPLDDVLDAVDGWKFSAFHRGENGRGEVYNDLELLLRDAQQIEKFRDLARGGMGRVVPVKRATYGDRLDESQRRLVQHIDQLRGARP